MKITTLKLQQLILLLFIFFLSTHIQAGFPAGTRIATPDFPMPLKFEKITGTHNIFKPHQPGNQTTIAYPAPQEKHAFFSVFKSTQDAQNYTAGYPYEYSASYTEFLKAY